MVSADVHWDQQQSQVEEISTWTVVPPSIHLAEIIVSPLPGIGVFQLEECRHEMCGEMMALGSLGNSSVDIISIHQQFHVGIEHCVHQLLTASEAQQLFVLGHHAAIGPKEQTGLRASGLEGIQHSAVLVISASAKMWVCLAVAAVGGQFQLFCCHGWSRGWSGGAVHKCISVRFVEQIDDCSGTCPLGGLASRIVWQFAGGSGSFVVRVSPAFHGFADRWVETVFKGIAGGCGARGWHGGGGGRLHGRRRWGVFGIVHGEASTSTEPLATGGPACWADIRSR